MHGSLPEGRRLHRGGRLGRALRAEDGFTLIELLVAMVIIAIVFSTFSYLIASAIDESAAITNDSALQAEARSTLDNLTDEVRQAYPLTTSATSPFVTTGSTMPASPSSSNPFTFYTPARTYSSGAPTSFNMEEISYELVGTNLEQANATSSNAETPTAGGWTMPALSSYGTLVTNVTSFSLTYDTSSGTATTSPASVSTVNVSLTVKDPAGQSFTFVDSATLRVDE